VDLEALTPEPTHTMFVIEMGHHSIINVCIVVGCDSWHSWDVNCEIEKVNVVYL
jgi:hypothetical protein